MVKNIAFKVILLGLFMSLFACQNDPQNAQQPTATPNAADNATAPAPKLDDKAVEPIKVAAEKNLTDLRNINAALDELPAQVKNAKASEINTLKDEIAAIMDKQNYMTIASEELVKQFNAPPADVQATKPADAGNDKSGASIHFNEAELKNAGYMLNDMKADCERYSEYIKEMKTRIEKIKQ